VNEILYASPDAGPDAPVPMWLLLAVFGGWMGIMGIIWIVLFAMERRRRLSEK
jgi:hypothetical protein